MSVRESNNPVKIASRSANSANGSCKRPVQLASQNPNAGYHSFYSKTSETKRHSSSAPQRSNSSTNHSSHSLSADQILTNPPQGKSLSSLENQYTRGVVRSGASIIGDRGTVKVSSIPTRKKTLHPTEIGRCHSEQGNLNNRPSSPTPGLSVPSIPILETPALSLSKKPMPNPVSRGAKPREWTKERMHENNMEWRSGYENWRGRAAQIYNHMARELDMSLADHPYTLN